MYTNSAHARELIGRDIKKVEKDNASYPTLLKQIKNAPKALYIRGDAAVFSLPSIAIVGTRKASREGLELARRIAEDLARAGLVIVSGLAQGIDGASHKGALAGGGKTIGVLASSLEERLFFPYEHLQLAREMVQKGGTIVSEHAEYTPALKHHFIARNRIVSGLSLGVLVAEAPLGSGALITARFAREQGRTVFALPGSPFAKHCQGSNLLLKQGASFVQNASDVLEILAEKNLFVAKEKTIQGKEEKVFATKNEERIVRALERGQTHIDELSKQTSIAMSALLPLLMELELQGTIKNVGAGNYVVTKV